MVCIFPVVSWELSQRRDFSVFFFLNSPEISDKQIGEFTMITGPMVKVRAPVDSEVDYDFPLIRRLITVN